MAKQQRRIAAASKAARVPRRAPHAAPSAIARPSGLAPPPEGSNTKQTSHLEAVAVYEQGIRQLQRHDFSGASESLQRVVAAFPDERELCERARLYLVLCNKHLQPVADEPQSLPERLYAATLALNTGDVERAIEYLDGVRREDPTNDQALYMLATAYAQRGNVELAIPYLQQAIESNPDNRVMARFDPDLAGLRAEDTIAALLESPQRQPDDHRKRSVRSRPAR